MNRDEFGRTVPWRDVASELFDRAFVAVAFAVIFSAVFSVCFVWITILRRPWPWWLREAQNDLDNRRYM